MKKILGLLLLGSMFNLMGLTSEQLLNAAMKDNQEAASALISAIKDSAKQAKFIKLYNNKYGKAKGGADYVAPSGGADCFDWKKVGNPQDGPAKLMSLIGDAADANKVNDVSALDNSVLGKALNPLKGDKSVKAFGVAVKHYSS